MEHTIIGLYGGHYAIMVYNRLTGYVGKLADKPFYIIGFIMGVLVILGRFAPRKYRWIGRYGIVPSIAIGIGLSLRAALPEQVSYLISTLKPFTNADPMTNLSNLLIIIMFFSILSYFTFTSGFGGSLGDSISNVLSKIGIFGRLTLLAALGVGFMNHWQLRVSLLTGRIYFLLHDWLGLL
jgi:hypothetical protein